MRRERRNGPEVLCEKAISELGLTPTKRGWPDFMAFDDEGRLAFVVEVKPDDFMPLKKEQVAVMRELQRHGIKVMRYSPRAGFTEFNDSEDLARRSRHREGDVANEDGQHLRSIMGR